MLKIRKDSLFINAIQLSKKNYVRMQLFMSCVLLVLITCVSCNVEKVVKKEPCTKEEKAVAKNGKTVVIDAGHGGTDPGKVGVLGQLEKDINLQIALRLKKVLKDGGYEVFMTREEDRHLGESVKFRKIEDLNCRCFVINKAYEKNEDTIMISIHQNSFENGSVRGAQCFYYKNSKKSMRLAELMQEKLNIHINTGKEKKTKNNFKYYMLINSHCPGMIIECGFLSNEEEARKLETEEYQLMLANLIKEGIDEYFQGK